MTKTCFRCSEELPIKEFYASSRNVDGYEGSCKRCRAAYQQARAAVSKAATNPAIIRDKKTCTKCRKELPTSEFWASKRNADWLSYYCKSCEAEKNRRVHEADPSKRQKLISQWKKDNPDKLSDYARRRRATRNNADLIDLTDEEWQTLLRHNGYSCAYCGDDSPLTQDHAIPLSRGGNHTLTNMIPACLPCNSSKRDKTPLEFLMWKLEVSDAPV